MFPPEYYEEKRRVLRASLKDETFLDMAERLGQLGTCDRKKVGAIITWRGRCISWGFNGAPPGMPHCEENYHGYAAQRSDYIDHMQNVGERPEPLQSWLGALLGIGGCRNVTHAEANALAFAARSGISTDGGTCFVTVSPCDVCARLLIAAGIVRVVFAEEYRDPRGVEILREGGVQIG